MELKKLKDFIEFMDENSLSELELEEEGKRVRLKKFASDQPVMISQAPITSQPQTKDSLETKKEGEIEIKSPMVGTFYRSASPGAKTYVETGDSIKPGDVICLIEAMKLMNEIKAETGGKIAKILVENGQPVEFGQPIFILETA